MSCDDVLDENELESTVTCDDVDFDGEQLEHHGDDAIPKMVDCGGVFVNDGGVERGSVKSNGTVSLPE